MFVNSPDVFEASCIRDRSFGYAANNRVKCCMGVPMHRICTQGISQLLVPGPLSMAAEWLQFCRVRDLQFRVRPGIVLGSVRDVLYTQSQSLSSSSTVALLCRILLLPPSSSSSFFFNLGSPSSSAPTSTSNLSTSSAVVLTPLSSLSVTNCFLISPSLYINTVGVFFSGYPSIHRSALI